MRAEPPPTGSRAFAVRRRRKDCACLSGHDSSLGACNGRWSGSAGPPECVTPLTTGEADLPRRARRARQVRGPGSGHLGYPEVGQRELELTDIEHFCAGFPDPRSAHGPGPFPVALHRLHGVVGH